MPRRYKPMRNVRRVRPFKPMVQREATVGEQIAAEHRAMYPSHVAKTNTPTKNFVPTYKNQSTPDESRIGASKNFTVAIAYNKGAYQVIPAADIQHIGR